MQTIEGLKAYKKKHYQLNKEKYIKKAREWEKQHMQRKRDLTNRKLDENREAFRERQKTWAKSNVHYPNPVRDEARRIYRNALRRGEILKSDYCTSCGATGELHGHHDDYNKPFAVRWLCPLCHGKAHRMRSCDEALSA